MKNVWYTRVLCLLMLLGLAFSSSLLAEDVADVIAQARERAAKIAEAKAIMSDPDQNVRLAAFDAFAGGEDPLLRDAAIEAGLTGSDSLLRDAAFRHAVLRQNQLGLTLELDKNASKDVQETTRLLLDTIGTTVTVLMDEKTKDISKGTFKHRGGLAGTVSGSELTLNTTIHAGGWMRDIRGTLRLQEDNSIRGVLTIELKEKPAQVIASANLL